MGSIPTPATNFTGEAMFDDFDTQIQCEEYEEYYWNNDDDFYGEEYPEESFTPKKLNLEW